MKKWISLSLVLCLLMGLLATACPAVAAAEPEKVGKPLFDENNIVLSFGAISDLHILGDVEQAASKKYETALRLLKKHAGGKLDAITIAGDISNSTYNSNIGEAFKTITDAQMGENANVFFVTGNHDAQENQWDALAQFYADQGKYLTKDLPSSQHDRGNRHMVIGGYHYIGVNMMDYWNKSEALFAEQDLQWLDRELASARAAAPGKPIFVYLHAAVYGATYGSDLYTGTYWGSKKIYDHLKDYPEVVTFSGHLHFPIHDNRTIYQKDFTSLNCGSVQYMSIDNGYLQSTGNTTVAESNKISNGLLVQVDKQNNLKITRLDFANDAVIKEPFYITTPDLKNKTHLTHYNDEYFSTHNTAPVFGKNAGVSGAIVGENMEVTFDAASDNDMVHHYAIEIEGVQSGTVKSVKAFSEFYLYPTVEKMPLAYTMKIPYTLSAKDTTYRITLRAVDSMGMQSDPLTYTHQPGDKPPVITGVVSGTTYYTTQKVTVTDDNLATVLVNGQEVKGTVLLSGNVDTTYTVMAVDKGGNRTATVISMKPVSAMKSVLGDVTEKNVTFTEVLVIERLLNNVAKLSGDANASSADKTALAALKAELDKLIARVTASTDALNTDAIDKVRDITAADVTPADKANLQAALADYNKALATYGGNYSEDTKAAIAEEMTRVEEALQAIGVTVPTTKPTEGTTVPTEAPTEAPTAGTALPTDAIPDPTAPSIAPTEPADSTAPTLLDEGAGEKGNTDKKTSPWLFVGIGIGAVALIGGGIALFLFLRKKK